MRVFIDTNIFLDFIQERPAGFKEAMKIIALSAKGNIDLLISDLSIANVKYSTRKDIPLDTFYETLKGIRELFLIVAVGELVVDRALAIEASDFEDALQYYSAVQAGADCLITRNIKDFVFDNSVETLEPKVFLEKYFPDE